MRWASLPLGVLGAVGAVLMWWWLAGQAPAPAGASSAAVRLGVAAVALLPGVGVLWAMLLVQMAARFVLARTDPLDGPDPPFLQVNQRAIANTVEHAVVFVPALLALAAEVDRPAMPGVVALGLVFAAARVAFWVGYLLAPIGRAIGMAATLAVTAGALGGAVAVWTGVAPW